MLKQSSFYCFLRIESMQTFQLDNSQKSKEDNKMYISSGSELYI